MPAIVQPLTCESRVETLLKGKLANATLAEQMYVAWLCSSKVPPDEIARFIRFHRKFVKFEAALSKANLVLTPEEIEWSKQHLASHAPSVTISQIQGKRTARERALAESKKLPAKRSPASR